MVETGYYQCGFQVNKKEHLCLMFGKSTIIGAYNIMFIKRHEFIIKTKTRILCYAIRMPNIKQLFNEFAQFERPMRQKVMSIYARNVYFPLMQ